MSEMKLEIQSMEAALAQMKQAVQTLEPIVHQEVKGENVLEVTDKLAELNHALEAVMKRYQQLSRENLESTDRSVQALKQTDKQLAGDIAGEG